MQTEESYKTLISIINTDGETSKWLDDMAERDYERDMAIKEAGLSVEYIGDGVYHVLQLRPHVIHVGDFASANQAIDDILYGTPKS